MSENVVATLPHNELRVMAGTKTSRASDGSLAVLFAHVTPRARTFFTGNLCQNVQFTDEGHLHLLKGGTLTVVQAGQVDLELNEPTLLFFPRGRIHSFTANPDRGDADLVCATVELGGAEGNPIGLGLPELVVLPLASRIAR